MPGGGRESVHLPFMNDSETIAMLKGIIAQHDLCHDLHGKVGVFDFCKGCADEQQRLYGQSPDAEIRSLAVEKYLATREYCKMDKPNIQLWAARQARMQQAGIALDKAIAKYVADCNTTGSNSD